MEPRSAAFGNSGFRETALRLFFHGAAGTVTGSKYRLSTGRAEILVDAGLFQGLKRLRLLNWALPAFSPNSLDAVLLTHVHLDHTGYLPRLVGLGFRGPVFATRATIDLAGIVLRDAARLQEEDAEYANRKGYSRHRPAKPLFDTGDAERALDLLEPVGLDEWVDLGRGARARWTLAGHLLGAASIEVRAAANGGEVSVLFSGDLGRSGQPIHPDPVPRPPTDYLVVESTYGDRVHPSRPIADEMLEPVGDTLARGGVVLVPSFALGRAQLVTLTLRRLMEDGRIPDVPVHLDSPMAIDATEVYTRHRDVQREENGIFDGDHCLVCPKDVKYHRSVEDSKRLNELPGPRVIIAGSGMLTGGRILHHLRTRVSDPDTLVCLVGYQAEGTRGRALADGAPTLRMHGHDVPVRARTAVLHGFSGHADADELSRWVATSDRVPSGIFVTHGEPKAAAALAERLGKETRAWTKVPELGEAFSLETAPRDPSRR